MHLALGATGKVGRRVAARLRVLGHEVRAVSRRSSPRFDWDDPATWSDAVRGVRGVYAVAPPRPGTMAGFVELAATSGVQRIVMLSGRGPDRWTDSTYGAEMVDAERAVRASSLEWTIVRPSNFDQNFDEDVFHAPLVAGELRLPAEGVVEPFVDVHDVADVLAAALHEDGHAGRIYEPSGPRGLGLDEAVGVIARAAGRPIRYSSVGAAEYVTEQESAGQDVTVAGTVAEMFRLLRRGLTQEPTPDVQAVLRRPPRAFEDFAVAAAARGAWDAPRR